MIFCHRRPAAGVFLLAIVTATLSGCSGSGSGAVKLSNTDPLSTVVTAMQRAKSGKITGTVDTPHRQSTNLSGVWEGGLSGELQADATFTTRKAVVLPAEIRVLDAVFYYRRAIATVSNEPILTIFARDAQFKPWRAASMRGIVPAVPAAFSPAALVEWLHQLRVPVRVAPGKPTHITTTRPIVIGAWTGATVDMTVDGRARVTAVRITSQSGGAQYTVNGFGAHVDVTKPPASLMSTGTELPKKEPAGPFMTVKSGTTNGVKWSVQRAPGTADTVCWRFQATPPLPEAGLSRPGDPRCVTKAGANPAPEDTVTFVVDGNSNGPYDALAIQLPPGAKDVKLGFVGGRVMSLPASQLVVWVGPSEPVKGYVGVTLADGTRLDCGAGAIATPADLTDPTVNSNVGPAAWGCLQHTS
jgi:hypothetical protein